MSRIVDLQGRRFGRLVVVRLAEREPDPHAWWVCDCDCGRVTEVRGARLLGGTTSSCGCLRRESAGANRMPVVGPDGTVHPSVQAAARAAGWSTSVLQGRLRRGTAPGWRYAGPGKREG